MLELLLLKRVLGNLFSNVENDHGVEMAAMPSRGPMRGQMKTRMRVGGEHMPRLVVAGARFFKVGHAAGMALEHRGGG